MIIPYSIAYNCKTLEKTKYAHTGESLNKLVYSHPMVYYTTVENEGISMN